jgi:hypothetical protein
MCATVTATSKAASGAKKSSVMISGEADSIGFPHPPDAKTVKIATRMAVLRIHDFLLFMCFSISLLKLSGSKNL